MFSLLDVETFRHSITIDIQTLIDNHSKVFREMNKGIMPTQYYYHAIQLQIGNVPPNIKPYRYPYARKSQIEYMGTQKIMKDENVEMGYVRT